MGPKVFVTKLPWGCTEKLIEEMFEKYGTILSVNIIRDKETSFAKFAFVEFDSKESVKLSIEGLDGHDGKLVVKEAQERRKSERNKQSNSNRKTRPGPGVKVHTSRSSGGEHVNGNF